MGLISDLDKHVASISLLVLLVGSYDIETVAKMTCNVSSGKEWKSF